MADQDVNFVISATDKTAAAFMAVEKNLSKVTNTIAASGNKLAGVANYAGLAAGHFQGLGKVADAASVGIGAMATSIGILGGPTGLIMGAVLAVAAFASTTEKAAASTKDWDERLASLRGGMEQVRVVQLRKELVEAQKAAKALGEDFQGINISGVPTNRLQDYYKYASAMAYATEVRKELSEAEKEWYSGGKAAKEAEKAVQTKAKKDADELAAERQKLADKFVALQESLYTEEQALDASYLNRMTIVATAEANNVGNQEQWEASRLALTAQYQQQREQMEWQHQANLGSAYHQGLLERDKFTKTSMVSQTKTVIGELTNMTAGVAQHNRAMFEINKVAATADAIIGAHEGAARTMGKYPYPLNVALAALSYAAGIARVQAIQSTSFSGGGSGTTPSSAGTVPVINDTPVTNTGSGTGTGTGTGGTTTLNVFGTDGTVYTQAQMEAFLDYVEDAINRGDRLIINRNSRQAMELMS